MLFFILFLSFCLRVIRKGLRKNSENFVNLRRSSGQSMPWVVWPLTTIFDVQECSWLYWRYSGALWDVPGYYGMFQGCSGVVPGMFRGVAGVPGCSGSVPGFTDTQAQLVNLAHWLSDISLHLPNELEQTSLESYLSCPRCLDSHNRHLRPCIVYPKCWTCDVAGPSDILHKRRKRIISCDSVDNVCFCIKLYQFILAVLNFYLELHADWLMYSM